MSAAELSPALAQLAALLRKRPHTAKDIVSATKCSKPTAYARVRALIAAGVRVQVTPVQKRQKTTGPQAVAYSVG